VSYRKSCTIFASEPDGVVGTDGDDILSLGDCNLVGERVDLGLHDAEVCVLFDPVGVSHNMDQSGTRVGGELPFDGVRVERSGSRLSRGKISFCAATLWLTSRPS